jgi:hypothetical protein
MIEPQASKAELQVPPDKDALALVEAIRKQAKYDATSLDCHWAHLATKLGVIESDAERLKVLLAERDAEREAGREALEALLAVIDESVGVEGWHLNGAIAEWGEFEWIEDLRALARVKGDS